VTAIDPVSLRADAVVLAAGSWSGLLTSVPVRPVRGQIVQLRFARPPLSRVLWGDDCYLVPWADGSVLVGATAEDAGFDESASREAEERLVAAARALLPAARHARVDEVRVGLRPATPDELPVIGRSSTMPGVTYATGHYRNGVLLAPLTAALVADLVLTGGADASRPAPDSPARTLLDSVGPARFNL
jgi:glycine/D-amino acid oxidase-like deaminating enzyme